MKRQNQPIRSSEEEAEELMKHGYLVGRIGVDATRKGLMKLSKVVFHKLFIFIFISFLVFEEEVLKLASLVYFLLLYSIGHF